MSTASLQQALEALQRGERMHARKLVRAVLMAEPRNEQAWLLMARVVDKQEQVVDCLEQAIKINPQNTNTARALRALKRPVPSAQPPALLTRQSASPPPQAVPAPPPAPPIATTVAPVQKPTTRTARAAPRTQKIPRRSVFRLLNWSLWFGALLVMGVVIVAFVGPRLAPADPLQENIIVKSGEEWHTPPFTAFTVPGFPLGSDQFGRDLLSRVLWGVRPTLAMVSVVAMVRLAIGTLIGLGAGWSSGRLGRWLDTLIAGALSIPVLMVALGAIAMLGADMGLLAFIVGLSINGWGETARIVREQTHAIKSQLYIEAAHALGASPLQILGKHILRQIMPMIWMLSAFEISGTLMVTAALGVLGYFIGGDVWIEVEDFVSRRVSGMPELGQMLATSWVNLLEPWPLFLTGSVIFIAVLGFNLLGEGLRMRLDPEYINRNSLYARVSTNLREWFEYYVSYPVGAWLSESWLRPVMLLIFLGAASGIIYVGGTRLTKYLLTSHPALEIPGGHLWSSEFGDPYGSRSRNIAGPTNPQIAWTHAEASGYSGGPAVAADGTLYIATTNRRLLALNPDNTLLWELELPGIPVSTPALGAEGTIYIAHLNKILAAISPDGSLLWTFQGEVNGRPAHGPIVSHDGTIFYLVEDPRGDTLFALQPDGQLLWQADAQTRSANTPLRISPDGTELYAKYMVFNAQDGTLVEMTPPTQNNPILSGREQYMVGGDGRTYFHAGHTVMQWEHASNNFSVVQSAEWNYRGAGLSQTSSFPSDAGVTLQGNPWLFYSDFYGGTFLVWLDPTGIILGINYMPFQDDSILIAIDGNNVGYVCGVIQPDSSNIEAWCYAYTQGNEEPSWTLQLGDSSSIILGGALLSDRLYVVTASGILIAIENAPESSSIPASSGATP